MRCARCASALAKELRSSSYRVRSNGMTSRPPNLASKTVNGYRKPDRGTQPDYCYPPYASTVKRSPSHPLLLLPTSLSEVTGPLFGHDLIKANDFDLTKQHA